MAKHAIRDAQIHFRLPGSRNPLKKEHGKSSGLGCGAKIVEHVSLLGGQHAVGERGGLCRDRAVRKWIALDPVAAKCDEPLSGEALQDFSGDPPFFQF